MARPADCRYLASHEWARRDKAEVVIGITDFAVEHLSDLTFLDLPKVKDKVEAGKPFGEIESVKAVSDLNAPVSGEVTAVHEDLAESLETLAKDPFGQGWMIRVKPSHPAEWEKLLDGTAYLKVCDSEGGH
ncbi:MAG: glycine cleavage system protein GcvH [Planctomycetales bacterium]|nr:glycine cleavage system protein GcvH [Planctomycetales bacterium]